MAALTWSMVAVAMALPPAAAPTSCSHDLPFQTSLVNASYSHNPLSPKMCVRMIDYNCMTKCGVNYYIIMYVYLSNVGFCLTKSYYFIVIGVVYLLPMYPLLIYCCLLNSILLLSIQSRSLDV